MYKPGSTQLLTTRPDGTQVRYLGRLGHVAGLKYAWALPGGPSTLSCTLQIPVTRRSEAMVVGRRVLAIRGASTVWEGALDEPVPGADGWAISAHGIGAAGNDYMAAQANITDWANVTPVADQAIARGLPWVDQGFGSGAYVLQPSDSATVSITDFMNSLSSLGAITWWIDRWHVVQWRLLPTTPTHLLVVSSPVARSLGGYYNVIWLRYQVSADATTGSAVFATTSVASAASIARHGRLECPAVDLTPAGNMTAGQAQAVGTSVLARYTAASYGGPIPIQPGDLRTLGGQPVDLGSTEPGMVCRLILTDYAYGGDVAVSPPNQLLAGGLEYDDDAGTASLTPFQSVNMSLSSLLSAAATALAKPAAAA